MTMKYVIKNTVTQECIDVPLYPVLVSFGSPRLLIDSFIFIFIQQLRPIGS